MNPNKLTRQQKIDLCIQLFKNTKDGTAIPSEYTIGKYDFLLSEGFVLCPNELREKYFDIAKSEYHYELVNMVHTDSIVNGHTAAKLLVDLEKGILTFDQIKYLSGKVKIIALKEFMKNAEDLKFG